MPAAGDLPKLPAAVFCMKYVSPGYIAAALADFLMPRECLVCGRQLLVHERHLCLECLSDMPLTYFWNNAENAMAHRYNEVLARRGFENGVRMVYSYAAALYYYNAASGYGRLSQALKYHHDIPAGRFLAVMLGNRLKGGSLFADVSAVLPVPLHWTRRLSRGYNQAEIIAGEVARIFGVPMLRSILRRHRRTRTQTKLHGKDKEKNVRGAFRVDRKAFDRLLNGTGGCVHVLIVDDVFTTGSTLASCHEALLQAMGEAAFPPDKLRVSVATLGYVGEI